MKREYLPDDYVRYLLDMVGETDVLDYLLGEGWNPPLMKVEKTVKVIAEMKNEIYHDDSVLIEYTAPGYPLALTYGFSTTEDENPRADLLRLLEWETCTYEDYLTLDIERVGW